MLMESGASPAAAAACKERGGDPNANQDCGVGEVKSDLMVPETSSAGASPSWRAGALPNHTKNGSWRAISWSQAGADAVEKLVNQNGAESAESALLAKRR